jgi:RNA polymerase sigma-70 factor (ECF subfamily)
MNVPREQFERLALEQLDSLYRVARRMVRDAAKAEDLVQETYLRALKSAHTFDLQFYGIKPWLLRIMHNIYVGNAERESHQPAGIDAKMLVEVSDDSPPSTEISRESLYENMDQQLVAAMETLPADYQQVLHLWAVEELSYKEISEVMGVPIGTIMSRLHRARQKMATQLREYAHQQRIIKD